MKKESKQARGARNKNHGNILNSPKTKWMGEVDEIQKKDSKFEEFKESKFGYRALIKTLQTYRIKHNCQTIEDFIKRWAPPIENNTSNYISRVCKEMQVPSVYIPDINDQATMVAFAAAISIVENGDRPIMKDIIEGWRLL
nr:structural protein P5 [uncultured Macellibacteroides sp.]